MGDVLAITDRWVQRNIPPGFSSFPQSLHFALGSAETGFLDRANADSREDYKQVCTYCLITHGDSVLVYGRGSSGGEAQLYDRLSLGVGGHVERSDIKIRRPVPSVAAITEAARREIAEEVYFDADWTTFRIFGVVRDDDTPVGRRHLGIVYAIESKHVWVSSREPSIVSPAFHRAELVHRQMRPALEQWSQILIDWLVENRCERCFDQSGGCLCAVADAAAGIPVCRREGGAA